MSHHKAYNYAAGNKFRHGLIKRESGENPERSRHCISWFEARCHWGIYSGKAPRMEMLKSGDLLFLCKDSCGRREIFTHIIDRRVILSGNGSGITIFLCEKMIRSDAGCQIFFCGFVKKTERGMKNETR